MTQQNNSMKDRLRTVKTLMIAINSNFECVYCHKDSFNVFNEKVTIEHFCSQ